jgi:hypothetical protein
MGTPPNRILMAHFGQAVRQPTGNLPQTACRAPLAPPLAGQPFHRHGWVYREKVDGYRMLAYKQGNPRHESSQRTRRSSGSSSCTSADREADGGAEEADAGVRRARFSGSVGEVYD